MGGRGPLSNILFLGLIRVLNPNLIGSAVFAGLIIVTDRPTDRPRYSVGNNRLHLRNNVMQQQTGPFRRCGGGVISMT